MKWNEVQFEVSFLWHAAASSWVQKVGVARHTRQIFDRIFTHSCEFLIEMIMYIQHFNFAFKFFQNGGFSIPNGRKFSDNEIFWQLSNSTKFWERWRGKCLFSVALGAIDITGFTRVIPKVSGLYILDNNIFHNLYISETYILYEL